MVSYDHVSAISNVTRVIIRMQMYCCKIIKHMSLNVSSYTTQCTMTIILHCTFNE